ncbi:sugar transferase [Reichenbachiella sp.]|uniref:sugar transferase n=1 Tax=Reichenbachiella sp. TaxID=2184521 RepID=UPI003B5B57A3
MNKAIVAKFVSNNYTLQLGKGLNLYCYYIKPLFDKVFSMILCVLLLPIGLFIIGLLLTEHFSSPFFIQARPGKDGSMFRLIKFRTMNDTKDANGELRSDDQRITRLGHWLRKLSLDEIPQLLNVIKGEMSLVGPRPLLAEYLPLYNEEQKKRHEVLPGITGWAQVNGRNTIKWEERFKLDLWYVDHIGFWLDIRILLLTVKKVVLREGVSSDSFITMEKFKGTTQ